jgi:hypothetical protein
MRHLMNYFITVCHLLALRGRLARRPSQIKSVMAWRPSCLLLLLSLWLPAVWAAPISSDQARQVALHWMNTSGAKTSSFTSPTLATQRASKQLPGSATLYTVNLQPAGFVVVSGDDAVQPVIFYTDAGQAGQRALPPQLNAMLEDASGAIEAAQARSTTATAETKALWNDLLAGNTKRLAAAKSTTKAVTPLVSVTWDQGQYYNALCPADSLSDYDGRVLVGCVAVAIGQVMAYHGWPSQGVGSHSYTASKYGTLTANFGATTYNWGAMPAALTGYNTNVATLLYHCGVGVDMNYGPDSSGAYSSDAVYALKTYFNYASTLALKSRISYSDSAWLTLLRGELDAARPFYYAGYDKPHDVGHAFVLDGYQNTNYFHVNWGWGGYGNGYFYLNSLGVDGYNFSLEQEAILGIKPNVTSTTSVSGYVRTTAGVGISGATVIVTDWNNVSYSRTTNGSGFWSAVPLNGSGTITVSATASGYAGKSTTAAITSGTSSQVNLVLSVNQTYGQLKVTLSPTAAVSGGARWRRVGTTDWIPSGITEVYVPGGTYMLEFKEVANWITPSSKSVTVTAGSTANATATYAPIPQVGALQMSLAPGAAVAAGACWRRVGSTTWQASDAIETDIASGSYTVEFSDAAGWLKPTTKSITISTGQTTSDSATYIKKNAVPGNCWALY